MGADPYVVVVKGHGHPSPDDVWVDVKSNGPFEMKKTKYLSFDKQYKIDFDQVLNDYLTDENTIMDCRKSAGTNVLPQEPAL